MAGIGTAPKPAEQRRRGNKPARGEWVDLEPLDEPVLPDLPRLVEGDWRPETKATWEAWRMDPVSAQWSPSDVAYALDAIRFHNAMTPSNGNEVRLRMDALGLTPKGKRDLRWRVSDEVSTPTPKKASAGSSKRRARLSLVS